MDNSPLPGTNSKHVVMIAMLFGVLLLTLAAVAMIVTNKQAQPSEASYALACKAEVENAVLDATREIARTCTVKSPETLVQVPAQENTLGFAYPRGWSAQTVRRPFGPQSWTAQVVPGYFAGCEECDGPAIDVTMTVGNLSLTEAAPAPSLNDFLISEYADGNIYTNIVIDTAEANNHKYTVTGRMDGLFTAPFEAIYYGSTNNPNTWARIVFIDLDLNETVSNDGWAQIKASIDTSKLSL
ncbi:MAG: hypothetical protein WAZ14_00930 [Patescibacteria group bacterium]